ncbi:hypothetical protein HYALB_00000250 [Hymenoscyphus albidus]|uniref:Iron-sulfur assembly protein 1 n=1 Tax=Hymenoscyphus albidus TaxID=595503 RepID=A0A9N9LV70_9HELO|nr:hypothetical protein HYALB_00000250 [Hymenoscyphus albidus]
MPVQRILSPLASSAGSVFRFAPSPTCSSLRPCQYLLRSFSSSQSTNASSKRKMQTSTAWQPHTLGSQPPPPLTGGIPSSVTPSIPQVNDIRPPPQPVAQQKAATTQEVPESATTLKEQGTQESEAAIPATKTRRGYTLRPRKAAMKLTPGAVEQLRTLLDQPNPKLIKVSVKNKGCSGLAYHLEYVDKAGPFDEVVVQDGVKVVIDSGALMSIIDSTMDWTEDKLNQKFVFTNPNIKEECGCGESFMV